MTIKPLRRYSPLSFTDRRNRGADCLCSHGHSFPFFRPRAQWPQAAGILHDFSFSRQGSAANFEMSAPPRRQLWSADDDGIRRRNSPCPSAMSLPGLTMHNSRCRQSGNRQARQAASGMPVRAALEMWNCESVANRQCCQFPIGTGYWLLATIPHVMGLLTPPLAGAS